MANVVVTGASGGVGPWLVRELVRAGHRVTAVDRVPPREPLGVPFRQAELTDQGQAYWAVSGAETVVHFAAIPAPGRLPDHVVFDNNVTSTWHVLEAAARLGVRRVIFASSLSAYGFAWADQPFPPHYFPVDEAHPLLPKECYGLSKVVGEQICATFTRRTGVDTVCLRPPYIVQPDAYPGLARLHESEEWARRNLWAYCDVRDVAQAVRLAVEHPEPLGHQAFIITAADAAAPEPTLPMIRRLWPEVPADAARLQGFAPAYDITRAQQVLGFRPAYSWRQQAGTVSAP